MLILTIYLLPAVESIEPNGQSITHKGVPSKRCRVNVSRSALKVFISDFGSNILGFILLIFLTRTLDAGVLGSFFLFQALLGLLAIPVDFGIRSAVTKRMSEGESASDLVSTAILLKLLPLIAISGLLLLFRHRVSEYLGASLVSLLILALFLQEAAKFSLNVIKGELRVGDIAIPSFAQQSTFVGLAVIFVFLDFGVSGVVYALIAGYVSMLIWGVHRMSIVPGNWSWSAARSLWDYAKYASVSMVSGFLYNWMDLAIIGLFLSQADVSIYEVSWRLTTIVMLLGQAMAVSVFPKVSQLDAGGNNDRIEDLIPKAISPVIFLVIPAFFGTLLLSQDMLGVVFGQEYSAGWLVLVILMGEKVIQTIHVIIGRALQGIDKPRLAANSSVIAIILNVVLNLIFVWWFGLIGAAIATLLSFTVNTALHAYYLSKFVRITLPFREIFWAIVASFVMAAGLLVMNTVIKIDSIVTLSGFIIMGILLYGIVAYSISPLRGVVNDIITQMKN
ncbi:flippase [Halorubrum sp. Atlit-28R]|nr:flippase [Halorubrum sp. Atlit-28R]